MSSFESSIAYLQRLIEFPSVSSTSNREISDWVSNQLEDLGFTIEQTDYQDRQGVEKVNIVAKRDPISASPSSSGNTELSSSPTNGLAYFCHTDVVPTRGWNGPDGDQFSQKFLNNRLYGRGSCDMKGSLATMMACAETLGISHQKKNLFGLFAPPMKKWDSWAQSTLSNIRSLTAN
ncbi:MAG: M20/M25/M40 family metallo-hydrolase [Planctomycetota bacterium]|nr:M20/M25/M40 family metallo-hydrolase [Planctomycetota bacterium]